VPVFSTVKQWYGSREGDRDIVIPALEDPGAWVVQWFYDLDVHMELGPDNTPASLA
jgi:hypothetical protein